MILRNYVGASWEHIAEAIGSPSADAARMMHARGMIELGKHLRERGANPSRLRRALRVGRLLQLGLEVRHILRVLLDSGRRLIVDRPEARPDLDGVLALGDLRYCDLGLAVTFWSSGKRNLTVRSVPIAKNCAISNGVNPVFPPAQVKRRPSVDRSFIFPIPRQELPNL